MRAVGQRPQVMLDRPFAAHLRNLRGIEGSVQLRQGAFPLGQAVEQPGLDRVARQEDVHPLPQVRKVPQHLAQPLPGPVPGRLQVDHERYPLAAGFQGAQVEGLQGALGVQVAAGVRYQEFISDPKDVDLDVGDAGFEGVEQGPGTLIVIVRVAFYAR